MKEQEEVFGDMSEKFVFDEEEMEYLDGPLSGWLRNKRNGERFAFDCQPIVANMLWHWTLVPTDENATEVTAVLASARRTKAGHWLSIVEDRRTGSASTCRCVAVENSAAVPVVFSGSPRADGPGMVAGPKTG